MSRVFKKLQYKAQDPILVLQPPDSFQTHLDELFPQPVIANMLESAPTYTFAIVFVKGRAEIEALAKSIAAGMKDDSLLWFAYPKKSSKKFKTDISRDQGWQPLGDLGYEPVRIVAIDDDWSALRFRHVSHIKSITRKKDQSLSGEGKRRAR